MAELVKDPVCGMEVDPDTAAASFEHEAVTYYFCSESCRQAFAADPAKYLVGAAEPPAAEPAAAPAPQAPPRKRWWEFWKA